MTTITIKILGSRCASCRRLERNAKIAVAELGISAEARKVVGIPEIIAYGVARILSLVINEQVYSQGKVQSVNELKTIFSNVFNQPEESVAIHE